MTLTRTRILPPVRAAALASLLLVASCAGGGGSTGTGITTAQGNVASTETASVPAARRSGAERWITRLFDFFAPARTANAVTGIAGVRVRLEGTSLSTETDANGLFSLAGSFGGPTTLVFSSPAGGMPARLDVDVPTGGTLTLDDVRLDDRAGRASPDRQRLAFDGVVAATNCASGDLSMVSEATPSDGNTYPVNVADATLRDSEGGAIQCADLGSGDVLTVQGDVGPGGAIDCREADRHRPPGSGPGGNQPAR